MNFKTSLGQPYPFGPKIEPNGVNFALYSRKKPSLALFEKGVLRCFLPMHRTDYVWHLFVHNLPKNFTYKYKIGDKVILDPFARSLDGNIFPTPFDWQNDKAPRLKKEELVIYELHVKGFAKNFAGVEKKIPYLRDLGITAVELMPIFSFDRADGNFWGYNTDHFFALHPPYGTIEEFKSLVRALHKNRIEIYLDVVYNHSSSKALRLLAPNHYFMHDSQGHDMNFSGCGNTMNCNDPITLQLILESLRYFVQEMHVDGFRFDLASILMRGAKGEPLKKAPLIEAISTDPLLSQVKLIAEPWDPGGLYKLGAFPKNWMEWNGQFRDQVRQFIKGTDNMINPFATRLCGSHDLFRNPVNSINFVTCHDGFSLRDLVSYNQKHNEENGEENRDGENNNNSWNCGVEGKTKNPTILALRERQIKNFFFTLLISQGTPMIYMGDEYGHTKGGNNNTWRLDTNANWFDWKASNKITEFVKKMIFLRKGLKGNIIWHGVHLNQPDRSSISRFIAFTRGNHYIAINACFKKLTAELPQGKWKVLIDTNNSEAKEASRSYTLAPYSSILLQRIVN